MKAMWTGAVCMAAALAPPAFATVADGNDCGGFTPAEAAAWLKVPAAQVSREVTKAGDKWMCSFSVGKSPAITFSLAVASSAKRAQDELDRYRDDLSAAGATSRWKDKLPNGIYSDMFGTGDEGVWTDMSGSLTVRRDNVIVRFNLPKGKDEQVRLGKVVVEGF